MKLKEIVLAQCQLQISQKLNLLHKGLRDLLESAGSETKSSAGDKFETGRAMLHIEQDHVRRQIAEALAQKAVLDSIVPGGVPERAGLGTLIRASGSYYFLSTALGKIEVEGNSLIALSLQSPLGSKFAGQQPGASVTMNGKTMVIEELF